jgi:hypothetical protein
VTDRDLQDEVIRALADAPYRRSSAWLGRDLAPSDRVERFARFLARRFSYQRVVRFFRYSRALGKVTGRRPEEALRSTRFDALLPEAVLGSRETAERVAALVRAWMSDSPGAVRVPYLDDLLRYEEAMMVAEAGPRGPDASEGAPEDRVLWSAGTARVLDLGFDLPAVLPAILGSQVPPTAPRRPTTLVVTGSPRGRVTAVRATEDAVAVVEAAREPSSEAELAGRTGLDPERLGRTLRGLVEVGAVRPWPGS